MNVVLNEFISSLEELSGQDDDRGGTITDFSILDLGELDKNFGSWMCDLQLLQDCGAIVGDRDVTDIVDEHLIEALRTKRGLDDVGKGEDGHDVLCSDILSLFSLSEDTDL
jgi:hypothetical protein